MNENHKDLDGIKYLKKEVELLKEALKEDLEEMVDKIEKEKLKSQKPKEEQGESKTTEENVTTEENNKMLEELQKDFRSSKESSISFPNIDKVNKKLSDLFDYIGKYTMEESEETKELEKQQIEAEIELAKAEAKQAIREAERKFGKLVLKEKIQDGNYLTKKEKTRKRN